MLQGAVGLEGLGQSHRTLLVELVARQLERRDRPVLTQPAPNLWSCVRSVSCRACVVCRVSLVVSASAINGARGEDRTALSALEPILVDLRSRTVSREPEVR